MKKFSAILAASLLLALPGCGTGDATTATDAKDRFATISGGEGQTKPRIVPSDLPPPKRMLVRDIRVGEGPVARRGDWIAIYYLGVYQETSKERSSRWAPESPFEFELGSSASFDAWEEGIEGMKVGGRREMLIPSHLLSGVGTVDYVVDLLAVKRASKG